MMSPKKTEGEGKIYRHVQQEAYKARIITRQTLLSTPRSLLLPGREENWLCSIATRVARNWVKKGLPDLTVVTRLHPPINLIAKKQLRTIEKREMRPQEYLKHTKNILQEWKNQGRPRPGRLKVGNTEIAITREKGSLVLRAVESHGSMHFVVGSGWPTFEDYEGQLRFPKESLSDKHRNSKPHGWPKKNRI